MKQKIIIKATPDGQDSYFYGKWKDDMCKHCDEDIRLRNPSGYCDHLYYPENCKVCNKK